MHDTILLYCKSEQSVWNTLHLPHNDEYIRVHYPHTEPETGRRFGLWDVTGPGGAAKGNPSYEVFGITKYWRYSRANMERKIQEGRVVQPRPGAVPREKRYLDESGGVPIGSVWTDISPINSQAAELLDGQAVAMPPVAQVSQTFKKAPKAKADHGGTLPLPL